jgi:ribonuclease PH
MLQVNVVCSSCAEESDVLVEDLDAVEREVCECGYSFVVLSVAEFEPVEIRGGQLIELRRRDDLDLAA